MALSLDTVLCLDFILVPITIILLLARQWILRKRPATAASIISDGSLIGFTIVIVSIGCMDIRNIFVEKGLRAKFETEEEVVAHLFTPRFLEINFAALMMYTIQLWLLKSAYLGYFWRIKAHLSENARVFLHATAIYSGIGFIVAIAIQLAWCRPIQRNWASGPEACVALSTVVGSTVQAWLSISSDILILILAIITVSSLQLHKSERTALIGVVVIGAVSPVMSTVRFVLVYKSTIEATAGPSLSVLREILLWGKFEVVSAHWAFCLPAFRVWFRRWTEISKYKSYTFSSGGRQSKKVGPETIAMATIPDSIMNDSGSESEVRRWNTSESQQDLERGVSWETEDSTQDLERSVSPVSQEESPDSACVVRM